MTEEALIEEQPLIESESVEEQQEAKPEPTAEEIEYSKAVQKRIDKEVWKRGEAERKYEATQAELAALRVRMAEIDANKPVVDSRADATGRPDPNKYPAGIYDPEYMEALTDFKVEQRTRQIIDEQEKKATISAQRQKIDVLEAKAAEAHPDYKETVSGLMQHTAMQYREIQSLVTSSDNPAELAYFLGKNPQEIDKVTALYMQDPAKANRYIGALESRLENALPTPPAKKLSDAPAPPTPLKGAQSSTVGSKDPDKMTMAEFAAYETARLQAKRQR